MGVGQPLSMKLKNVHLPHPHPNGGFSGPSLGGGLVLPLCLAALVVGLSEVDVEQARDCFLWSLHRVSIEVEVSTSEEENVYSEIHNDVTLYTCGLNLNYTGIQKVATLNILVWIQFSTSPLLQTWFSGWGAGLLVMNTDNFCELCATALLIQQ